MTHILFHPHSRNVWLKPQYLPSNPAPLSSAVVTVMWSCKQSSSFRSGIYTFCRLHSNPRAQLGIFRTLKLWSQSPMYDTRLLASYMMWSQSPIYDTRLLYMALGRKTEHPFSFLRRPEKLCQTMKPNLVPGRSLAILHQLLYLVCTTYFRRVSNTFGMYQTVLHPQGANIAPMFLVQVSNSLIVYQIVLH